LREIAAGVVRADTSSFDENENLREYAGPSARGGLSDAADAGLPPSADEGSPADDSQADELPPAADA
jgi:hypothetical protein